MNRRHQAFISSTFLDLRDARQRAHRVVLDLGNIPAGMELFPATHNGVWELIKRDIDLSDIYILIVGGRYGSLAPSGVGWTEHEYNYAIEQGKEVLAFLLDPLVVDPSENDAQHERLISSRRRLQSSHSPAYWSTEDDLAVRISNALGLWCKHTARPGWVRGELVDRLSQRCDALAQQRNADRLSSIFRSEAGVLDLDELSQDELAALNPRVDIAREIGYNLSLNQVTTQLPRFLEPDGYVTQFAGLIWFETQIMGQYGLAGRLAADVVHVASARRDKVSLFDVFDSVDDAVHEYWSVLFEFDTADALQVFPDFPYSDEGDVLLIHNIELLPRHRRRRVGLQCIDSLLRSVGSSCCIAAGKVGPRYVPPLAEQSAWDRAMERFEFQSSGYSDGVHLQRYLRPLGFRRFPGTPFVLRRMSDPLPAVEPA